MTPILAVTVPFFALVLCGYLAARRHVLPESAIPGLNTFVLYFALPCLLFRLGSRTPIVELLNPSMLGVYMSAAGLIVFFTITPPHSKTVRLQNAAFGALKRHVDAAFASVASEIVRQQEGFFLHGVAVHAPRRTARRQAAPELLADAAVLERGAVIQLHAQQTSAGIVANGAQSAGADGFHGHAHGAPASSSGAGAAAAA